MSVVRSPVRSVVRSPVRSVLGSGALSSSNLQQILALSPSLLIWPAKGSGWQGTRGGDLSATGQPVGLLPDLAQLGGKTQAAWLATPTGTNIFPAGAPDSISDAGGTIGGWSSGTFTNTGTAITGYPRHQWTNVLTVGRLYYIKLVATAAGLSGAGGTLFTNRAAAASPGLVIDGVFVANATKFTISAGFDTTLVPSFTLTEATLIELPGNHLRAGTWASPADSSRALLATDGEGRLYLDHDGVDDQYSLLNSTGVTDGTLCIVDNSGVYFQDFRDSGDYRAPDINLEALAIYPTVLTAGERATVASAFGRSSHTYADVLLALNGQTSSNLRLDTSDASAWAIDWGDGTTATPASAALATRTYASAYTGLVRATATANITRLDQTTGRVALGAGQVPATVTYMQVQGSNTLTGNVSDLPTGLTYLDVHGSNTLTGNVSAVPTGLTYMQVQGSNTLSGNVSALPTGLMTLSVTGSNTLSVSSATSWRTASMRYVRTYSALTSTEVDDLLIAMATVTSWTGDKQIQLHGGGNASRTAASDAAVSTIEGYGVTVVTTP